MIEKDLKLIVVDNCMQSAAISFMIVGYFEYIPGIQNILIWIHLNPND